MHNSRDDRFRKVFSNDGLLPAPSSLTKMISDQDGDLFFATLDGYIYSYNPHKNGYPQLIDFSKTGKVYLRDIALLMMTCGSALITDFVYLTCCPEVRKN